MTPKSFVAAVVVVPRCWGCTWHKLQPFLPDNLSYDEIQPQPRAAPAISRRSEKMPSSLASVNRFLKRLCHDTFFSLPFNSRQLPQASRGRTESEFPPLGCHGQCPLLPLLVHVQVPIPKEADFNWLKCVTTVSVFLLMFFVFFKDTYCKTVKNIWFTCRSEHCGDK